MKQQTNTVIYAGYDYLLGRSESLSITLDLAPAKDTLRENVWEALMVSLPPEAAELSQAELEQLFDEFYAELAEQIPATFTINETMINEIGPEIMGMKTLDFGRWIIGWGQLAYRISIGVMIGSIVGLAFLHRRVRGATRSIGIPLLISGISAFVWAIVARRFATAMIAGVELPAQLQTWLPQFMNDLFAPMRTLGIGFMAVGIALLIVSVVYKRGQSSAEQM
jgi:branched-subunit amino acid transport protein